MSDWTGLDWSGGSGLGEGIEEKHCLGRFSILFLGMYPFFGRTYLKIEDPTVRGLSRWPLESLIHIMYDSIYAHLALLIIRIFDPRSDLNNCSGKVTGSLYLMPDEYYRMLFELEDGI